MSRSVRRIPITGHARSRAGEEHAHKQRSNQALRSRVHATLAAAAEEAECPEALEEVLVPERRELRKHGYGPKDGKQFVHSPEEQRRVRRK